jgi:hypothetical protein
MTPAGLMVEDRECHGCDKRHVTVWWTTARGGFHAYCAECWPHYVGVYVP